MPTDKITDTLQLIKNDPTLQGYFFKKLAAASNPLEWLAALRAAGYFSPANNPKPQRTEKGYSVPQWDILDALINMAAKNAAAPDPEVTKNLRAIVEGIITYREDGQRINNHITDSKILAAISHFPVDIINEIHLQEFIDDALANGMNRSSIVHMVGQLLLPKAIKEKAQPLIIALLETILRYQELNKGNGIEYTSIVDNYYFKKFLDNYKKGISSVCAIEAARITITKINEILKKEPSQFNYIWIPTIEEHEQSRHAEEYGCQLVNFVREMLDVADPKDIGDIVHDMLHHQKDIFKRLAYHVINRHYGTLSPMLWSIDFNPLQGTTIHELYELFRNHSKDFSAENIKTVLNWIETQEYSVPESVSGDTAEEEHHKAYFKKEWLLSLIDSGYDEVVALYEHYNSINGAEIEHPGFHYWSYGVHSVTEESPISKEEVDQMSNEEFAEYISTYVESKESAFTTGFTMVSLAYSIRTFVSGDPAKFSSNLAPFLATSRKYQVELLRGFEEAWRNDKELEWEKLLSFALQLIEDETFWVEYVSAKNDHNRWIADSIAVLIQEGTKTDKHAFPGSLLPLSEQILLLLLKRVSGSITSIEGLLSAVLNAPRSKVLIAAIYHSLRCARISSAEKPDRWVESIKGAFDACLGTAEPTLEFWTVVGWHLLYIYSLDADWVSLNINRIFDKEIDVHWHAAFVGYIDMNSTLQEEIYRLLKDNDHYQKALSYPFREEHTLDKVVQNVVVGYLAQWDDFADVSSLMRRLFDTGDVRLLSYLVKYIPASVGKEKADVVKIKTLWKAVIEKIEPNMDKPECRAVASNLALWLSLVDTIDDDIFAWLKISAQAIEGDWNFGGFIRNLKKLVEKTPKMVGELYIHILDSGASPSYPEEEIIGIVQSLFDCNEKEIAARICNAYLAKGYEFLRNICNEKMCLS